MSRVLSPTMLYVLCYKTSPLLTQKEQNYLPCSFSLYSRRSFFFSNTTILGSKSTVRLFSIFAFVPEALSASKSSVNGSSVCIFCSLRQRLLHHFRFDLKFLPSLMGDLLFCLARDRSSNSVELMLELRRTQEQTDVG